MINPQRDSVSRFMYSLKLKLKKKKANHTTPQSLLLQRACVYQRNDQIFLFSPKKKPTKKTKSHAYALEMTTGK